MDVALCCIVGIRAGHNFFQFLKNKSFKPSYDFNNVVYLDYLPDNYTYGYEAGSFSSYLGKKICLEDDLYNGFYINLSPDKLHELKQKVVSEFKAMNLHFDEDDVQLHLFTRFY